MISCEVPGDFCCRFKGILNRAMLYNLHFCCYFNYDTIFLFIYLLSLRYPTLSTSLSALSAHVNGIKLHQGFKKPNKR